MKIMIIKKTQLLFNTLCTNLFNQLYSTRCLVSSSFYNLIDLIKLLSPFPLHVLYFIVFSIVGFLALKASNPRSLTRPRNIELYFTSVSALTVSSMSTVEMEVFSNFQLIVLATLILLGGEVFVSIIRLQFSKYANLVIANKIPDHITHVELGLITNVSHDIKIQHDIDVRGDDYIARTNSLRCLCYTVLCYFVVVHVPDSSSIALYINSSPSAKLILDNKGIEVGTFSFFATASSFTNCGFIPTNENMLVFKKHAGLLLIFIPQLLVGSSLYPVRLMFVILVLSKVSKRPEFGNILKKYKELGYNGHLMSKRRSCFLCMTVMGFLVVQLIVFVGMEWKSEVMDGLSLYEKVVRRCFK